MAFRQVTWEGCLVHLAKLPELETSQQKSRGHFTGPSQSLPFPAAGFLVLATCSLQPLPISSEAFQRLWTCSPFGSIRQVAFYSATGVLFFCLFVLLPGIPKDKELAFALWPVFQSTLELSSSCPHLPLLWKSPVAGR